ncbi:HNH endonuclease signature motif containing protein, partial [Tenggerimyces flavus]
VKLARHLDADLPATTAALQAGEISLDHARVVSKTVHLLPSEVSTPELRARVDATLAEEAKTFDARTLHTVGNHVLDNIDPDLADHVLEKKLTREEARAHRDRFFRMGWDETTGTWRVAGRLPKVVGERLKLVLDPLAAPQSGPDGRDTRTPEQRYADAIGEACRRLLAEQLVPSHGGNPTQLVITVTRTGGRTLHTGIELSRKLVEQLMCEADRAFLVKPDDQPGRVSILTDTQQRLFQGKLRRILELRDGGCAFPGCDRPPGWCHAHHVVPWSKGGPTTRDNGVLLCGYHHRLIHQGAWQVRIALDGLPEFLPPDWIDPQRQPLRHHRLTPAA